MTTKYYARRREAHIAKVLEWQAANPEKVAAYRAKCRAGAKIKRPWQATLYGAKSRAKKKGIEFDLDNEWCAATWTGKCALSGIEFNMSGGQVFAESPSIDRIDPTKGYTKANCRFVIWAVNRFKSDYSDDLILSIAKALVDHNAK